MARDINTFNTAEPVLNPYVVGEIRSPASYLSAAQTLSDS